MVINCSECVCSMYICYLPSLTFCQFIDMVNELCILHCRMDKAGALIYRKIGDKNRQRQQQTWGRQESMRNHHIYRLFRCITRHIHKRVYGRIKKLREKESKPEKTLWRERDKEVAQIDSIENDCNKTRTNIHK